MANIMGTNTQNYLKPLFKQIRFKNKWAEPAKPLSKEPGSPIAAEDVRKGQKILDNL